MDIKMILDVLQNTLDNIKIEGRENIERMLGAMNCVESLKKLLSERESEMNGRQVDSGTDVSNERTDN